MTLRRSLAGLLLVALAGASLVARAEIPLAERLARLPHLGTIVYVTAHPDDESGAIITYLARGRHARVVILAMTRGEGGQNQIGPELGTDLARVRTRELQQAAAAYGAEVRFLGADDFGYSKSVEETFTLWDENKLLGELVRQIRELRPLAVISNWSGTPRDGGGSHHQAAGILTRRAFPLAGDPQAFPEQIAHGYLPWQPRYLFIRAFNTEEDRAFAVPVQEASPVPGKTYEELGWEGFQNHRSQGMHQFRLSATGRFRRSFLRAEATAPVDLPAPVRVAELTPDLAALPDLFPSVNPLAPGRARLVQVVELAGKASRLHEEAKPAEAALALVQGAELLAGLRQELPDGQATLEARRAETWVGDKQQQFLEAAAALAGVRLNALADRAVITPGETVHVSLGLEFADPAVAGAAGFEPAGLQLVAPDGWATEPATTNEGTAGTSADYLVRVPPRADPAQAPYPALRAQARLKTGRLTFLLEAPMRGLGPARPDSAALNVEPVSLAPALTLEVGPRLRLLRASAGELRHDIWVRVENHSLQPAKTSVWLDVPNGWFTPLPQSIELAPASAATVRVALTVPGGVRPGSYRLEAAAAAGAAFYRLARERLPEGGNPAGYLHPPARARVEVVDVKVPPGLRIGYIGFNDDPVPGLLGQLGVAVDMLDERALAATRLDDYDAVLVSTRAYDYRDGLGEQTPRLLDYVKAGGTLVVEHQGARWDPAKFAPYPGVKPGGLRVTDETAAVRMLEPEHPLLNFPNRIGPDDWSGWVQERGLYFWESWSENYVPLVELADPGEEPLRGGLLYARHGQGVYIYCGLALFRQVRAGVAGGVRLYLNLLSQRRAPQAPLPPTSTEKE